MASFSSSLNSQRRLESATDGLQRTSRLQGVADHDVTQARWHRGDRPRHSGAFVDEEVAGNRLLAVVPRPASPTLADPQLPNPPPPPHSCLPPPVPHAPP